MKSTFILPFLMLCVNLFANNVDDNTFISPPSYYHPETWFHFIDGNVSKAGITADLEAISAAGISGVQLFHGHFGGGWPGVEPQIECLSPLWDEHVRFVAEECHRLGLRFTMQNCPGWAMSGGPWITPENAMRNIVMSRTDVIGGNANAETRCVLPIPQPSSKEWRDYRDLVVLAFPTPLGDENDNGALLATPLQPQSVESDIDFDWKSFIAGKKTDRIKILPDKEGKDHYLEITFAEPVTVRTVEFSSIEGFNQGWCYEPGVHIKIDAITQKGRATQTIFDADMPVANWQDDSPVSFACNEIKNVSRYRITFKNLHDMYLDSIRLYSAARKNSWESEAGWTLRSILREGEKAKQSKEAYVKFLQIVDVTQYMKPDGSLSWTPPAGQWTILRFGHVNAGHRNAPAPAEGTGWECNKLACSGPDAHFAGYIGRLIDKPLAGGLLDCMLLDSWECHTQTWTAGLDSIFSRKMSYELTKHLPSLFGYIINNQEYTSRFLLDFRRVTGDLFANKFYGRMAELARENGLEIQYETSAGDVVPADIMEYFKHADVPMAEFWQPYSDSYVGALNFKSIKPTVSAARLYGKPRIAAEAFTSFALTWDEHLTMLKEIANLNCIEGITHLVFHTYTHNPRTDWLPPGTSFGSSIGTPFLRGQTWWNAMSEFTDYFARLNYMLEAGRPVSDVLWYLGDEINHRPDQNAPFPAGYKYDYCNPDILLNRLSVENNILKTPEGLEYKVFYIPDNERMLPETLERIAEFVRQGVAVVGNAPQGLATLSENADAQKRFDKSVKAIWNKKNKNVFSNTSLEEVLQRLDIKPDVVGGDALWLHRCTENADVYYIAAPYGKGFHGTLSFNTRDAEMQNACALVYDPLTGETSPAKVVGKSGGRTVLFFDLPQAGACFVKFFPSAMTIEPFCPDNIKPSSEQTLDTEWTLLFPEGWGAPDSLKTRELKAWKDLPLSAEGKAFSGTAIYKTRFSFEGIKNLNNSTDFKVKEKQVTVSLDLGEVEMIAAVTLNGKRLRTLWTPPYRIDITDAIREGDNDLQVEVTSTWFNRLVYDANLPENERKTWTIAGPKKDAALRKSGLMGEVKIINY
ncbi:MAG: hypothetical protein LBJ17_01075 [Dysgonamonadaceae bacterium]|jgi:hypothetical protein|nr:hypothetical protein [Dysgonamonadaceae bacterium]